MLIFLICIILLQFATQKIDGKTLRKGPLLDKNEEHQTWNGLWFPHPPDFKYDTIKEKVNVANDGTEKDPSDKSSWQGIWFPHPPEKKAGVVKGHTDFINKQECDNGKSNIEVDFDPEDKRHSYNYLCLGNRTEYEPNLNTTSLLMEHLVPMAYEPPVRCLSKQITYDEELPTFGPYRPLAPKFGTYKYLPPQRWLRSLSDGAIVLLYHPCAFSGQKKQLENTLQGCLYRHIITPSQMLTPQRPLALLAWGKCLQMSVVDDNTVVKFIKENAKRGLRSKQEKLKVSSHQYEAGLLTEAHLVTDEQDSEICGYKEM